MSNERGKEQEPRLPPSRQEWDALRAENRALRDIARTLHWMARRYADGRESYATGLFNSRTRVLLELGIELNPTADGTIWARDQAGRTFDGLTDEEAGEQRKEN